MCNYCDENSYECEVFRGDNGFYLDVETSEWDEYYDEIVHIRLDINFCPYCGRKLGEEDVKPIILDQSNGDIEYECPMCGIRAVSSDKSKDRFCGECGCEFDWSETNTKTKSES